jgi:hypothetical protein
MKEKEYLESIMDNSFGQEVFTENIIDYFERAISLGPIKFNTESLEQILKRVLSAILKEYGVDPEFTKNYIHEFVEKIKLKKGVTT